MKGMDIVTDDETALKRIAYNVNAQLTESGMSRYRLAKITGESEPTIKSVADGAHVPRASLLARIAEAFGVKVDDLLQPIPLEKRSRKKLQEIS